MELAIGMRVPLDARGAGTSGQTASRRALQNREPHPGFPGWGSKLLSDAEATAAA
jgi:hypothetical protein